MPHLFLSYAHADRDHVFPLHAALESTGHYIWIDKEELTGGVEWESSIRLGIEQCYGVIFMITPSFLSSTFIAEKEIPWTLERFTKELSLKRPCIFPVLIAPDAKRGLEKHGALGKFQYVDAADGNFERAIAELAPLLPEPVEGGHRFIVNWPRLATFQGRGNLLHNLHEKLKRKNGKVSVHASIQGMGGVGKTQLAVEYAHRYRFHYPAGVYWLNGANDWKQEIMGVADRLRLSPADPNASDRAGQMVAAFSEYVRTQRADALVIVDNVEYPPDVVDSEIGPAGLKLTDLPAFLLITTRRADLPSNFGGLSVATMEHEPEAARAILREARPDEPNTAALDAICQALGYLPLALGLAAAALRKRASLSPAKFLQHLREKGIDSVARTVKVEHGDLNVPEYYNFALDAALDWHWEQLESDSAKTLIALAAAYGESAVIPLARLRLLADMPDDPDALDQPFDDALTDLRRANLIEDAGPNALRLHPLVREYVCRQVPDHAARLAEAAWWLAQAYSDPQILHHEVAARTFDGLVADLRETRLTLVAFKTENPSLVERGTLDTPALLPLSQLERLFDLEAHCLRNWQPGSQPSYLIQQIRERAHHQSNDILRSACDSWLARFSHFCTEDAWRLPHDSALIRTFEGHKGAITSMALSGDGRLALSGSNDCTLRLWDVESGQMLRTFEGHKEAITSMALSGDGRLALSGSNDRTLRLWDVASGQMLRTLEGHYGAITSVALSGDGRLALSGSVDNTVGLWDVASGQMLRTFRGNSAAVTSVALSGDGRLALSGSRDRTLRLWDVESGQNLRTFEGHRSWIYTVALSGDGRLALSGSRDRTLRLWDVESGQNLRTFEGHRSWIYAMSLSEDGRLVLSGSNDRTLRLWDVESGQTLRTFGGHSSWVYAVALSGDRRLALSGSNDNTLRLWDVETEQMVRAFEGHRDAVTSVALSGDGRLAVSGSADGTLQLWDIESGQTLRTFEGHKEAVTSVALSEDGRWALSGSNDNSLQVWDVESGQIVHHFEGHRTAVTSVALSGDGRRALSGTADGILRLWDVKTEQMVRTFEDHSDAVTWVALSGDGRWAFSGSADSTLRLWDVESGQIVRSFEGPYGAIMSVALSGDGRLVLSGTANGILRLWDVASGQVAHSFEGPYGAIMSVALSEDGRLALSGTADGILRLWDVSSWSELAALRLATSPSALCFVPGSGLRAFVGDAGGGVRVMSIVLPS